MPYKDPEKCKQRARERYYANKEVVRNRYRKYREENPVMMLLHAAKHRAKKRGLPFELAPEDVIIPARCPILGLPMVFGINKGGRAPGSPSLDRIDSTKGYTKDNVWVISHMANAMKYTATKEELLKFASWVNKTYAN